MCSDHAAADGSEKVVAALPLAELLACSFDRWYPHTRSFTLKSRVLPLDDDFVRYLLTDGVAHPIASSKYTVGEYTT